MKIAIFKRNNEINSSPLEEILESRHVDFLVNPTSVASINLAISLGGDGTFLWSVMSLGLADIPILGINSGRLGFLAGVSRDDVAAAIDSVLAGDYSIEERVLLKAEGDFGVTPDFPYAFNEFSVQKQDKTMVAVDVAVDGQTVATYWADGVLLSSPTGSTAYSLSVGGPVIAPNCDCLVISPIAPHNLGMRPLIVRGDSSVSFCVKTRSGVALATLDNREYPVGDMSRFTVRVSRHRVKLVQLADMSFYKTLQNKLMWGKDVRN